MEFWLLSSIFALKCHFSYLGESILFPERSKSSKNKDGQEIKEKMSEGGLENVGRKKEVESEKMEEKFDEEEEKEDLKGSNRIQEKEAKQSGLKLSGSFQCPPVFRVRPFINWPNWTFLSNPLALWEGK